jgi:hypothetical protein
VDVETTFFDLGGHSLALARVHARLVAELGREVSIAELFSHPTVASLAAHLARAGGRPAERSNGTAANGTAAAGEAAPGTAASGTVASGTVASGTAAAERGGGHGASRRAGLAALRRAHPGAAPAPRDTAVPGEAAVTAEAALAVDAAVRSDE